MQNIEIFENERAQTYDNFIPLWMPNYNYVLDLYPHLLQNNDSGDNKILVAGCGTGNEILSLVTQKIRGTVTGVDPSPEMIESAQKKLVDFNNVKLISGVVDELPTNQTFTAATLTLVLHFMPDDGTKLSLLKSIADRLTSNAPFILVDIFGSNDEIDINLPILGRLLQPYLTEEELSYRLDRVRNEIHHISEDRLIALLQKAGFEKPVRFHQATIYGAWITNKL